MWFLRLFLKLFIICSQFPLSTQKYVSVFSFIFFYNQVYVTTFENIISHSNIFFHTSFHFTNQHLNTRCKFALFFLDWYFIRVLNCVWLSLYSPPQPHHKKHSGGKLNGCCFWAQNAHFCLDFNYAQCQIIFSNDSRFWVRHCFWELPLVHKLDFLRYTILRYEEHGELRHWVRKWLCCTAVIGVWNEEVCLAVMAIFTWFQPPS